MQHYGITNHNTVHIRSITVSWLSGSKSIYNYSRSIFKNKLTAFLTLWKDKLTGIPEILCSCYICAAAATTNFQL